MYSFLPTSKQYLAISWASEYRQFASEDKLPDKRCHPLPLLPTQFSQILFLSTAPHGMEHAFNWFGSVVLVVPRANLLPAPSLPAFAQEVGGSALMLRRHRSATSVRYQPRSSHKCKAQHCMGATGKVNSIPASPRTSTIK